MESKKNYYAAYDEDFKKSIVTLYQNGRTQSQLSKEYGISMSAIGKWIKQYSSVRMEDGDVLTELCSLLLFIFALKILKNSITIYHYILTWQCSVKNGSAEDIIWDSILPAENMAFFCFLSRRGEKVKPQTDYLENRRR